MSWTFVDSDGANGAGSSTTIASPGLTVNVGDLVVVMTKWEGTDTTISISDGTSTLTPWSIGNQGTTASNNEPHLAVAYILASVASGTNSVVYTVTYGATRAFRDVIAMVFTPSSACSLDGTAIAGNSGAGTGTVLSSGNITTTGTDGIAFGAYAEYGGVLDSLSIKINSVSAANVQKSTGTNSELWNITYASGFTGAAAATISVANRWVLGVIAFKVGGAAASPTYPQLERGIRGMTRGITPGLA